MLRIKGWIISLIFIIFDAFVIYGVFYFSIILRALFAPLLHQPPVTWEASIVLMQLGILFVIGMFLVQGLYPGYGLTATKELSKMFEAITLAFILLATILYLVKSFQVFPRTILLIGWGLSIFILPIFRFLMRNVLSRFRIYGVPIHIYGEGEWAIEISESLKRVRRLGWRPEKIMMPNKTSIPTKVDPTIIAIIASTSDTPFVELVGTLNQHYQKVVLMQHNENFSSLWVETRDLDSRLGLEFQCHLLSRRNRWGKRFIDILGSLFLLIILSPLILVLSILIKLDSKGPVFYRQVRMGKDFHRINIVKFRTMKMGAEEELQKLLEQDPVLRAEYEEFHKLQKDPRVTKVGYFLRRFSLDELPQLWNVLKGEMSLSGPRAYIPSELENMGDYVETILRVSPGMTGWWQVLGRHNTSFQKRLQMDVYYISNWSLWMDVYIFLRTVLVVIFGKGA